MAVKLVFERIKDYNVDESEIIDLMEEADSLDQECIQNGIILSTQYEDIEPITEQRMIYIFDSKTNYENYLEFIKSEPFFEKVKTIWNWRIEHDYQFKIHLNYNYTIT